MEETKWKNVWRTQQELYDVQAFPNSIAFMSSKNFGDIELLLLGRYLLCTVWSKIWMSLLNSFDVRLPQSHECSVGGVYIKPSTIAHSQAGRAALQIRIS